MVRRLQVTELSILKDLPCHVTDNVGRDSTLRVLSSSTLEPAVFDIGPGADTLQMNHGHRLLYYAPRRDSVDLALRVSRIELRELVARAVAAFNDQGGGEKASQIRSRSGNRIQQT